MGSSTTISAKSQQAAQGSHPEIGISFSRSRGDPDPIGRMEEDLETPSIQSPDNSTVDKFTLENVVVDAESHRVLVDGAYDSIPHFRDVLRQHSQNLKH